MRYAITTKDNPYNPFEDFENWYAYDMNQSLHPEYYNTCSLLARYSHYSDTLTDEENDREIRDAIKRIIANDCLDI
jgi:hypothetical protein